MSDRRMYPTAYRRSALPQHVRQRGFQPLPMLPVSPRLKRGILTYGKWAGRLARLHPAVRALSTALDVVSLLPGTVPLPASKEVPDVPGYEIDTDRSECMEGPLYRGQSLVSCSSSMAAVYRTCTDNVGSVAFLYFTSIAAAAPNKTQPNCGQFRFCRGGYRMRLIPNSPQYGPITIRPARPGGVIVLPQPGRHPGNVPQPFPELIPPGHPSPGVTEIPYPLIPGRVPNPNRSPTEQSEWGNDVPPLIPNPEVPTPGVIVLPTPGNPSPEPDPSPQPDTPFPGPPATTRTRERKVILAVAGVPARIISAATETKDVIDAFWSAMPERFRRMHKFRYGRLTRPHEKAQLIWENLEQLDVGAAITNLAWEQLEDMAYGRLGKLQARAARKRRAMHGFTLGPAL